MRRTFLVLSASALAAACRAPSLPALTLTDREVGRVSITRGREDFALVQPSPGVWRVDGPDGKSDTADAQAVAALLAGLRSLRQDLALSGDGAAEGLSSDDATRIAVFAEGSVQPAFAARFGRRALGRAVHAAGDAGGAVLLVEGPDPALLARTSTQWRESRLLGPACSRVAVDAGRGFRQASAATAAALCAARAMRTAPDSFDSLVGLQRPLLRARSAGGALAVGARIGGERWVRVEGRPGLFRALAEPFETAADEAAR